MEMGSINRIKVLGILGMIDEGETDWKVIVINIKDCLAPKLNNINDIKKQIPGLLNSLKYWLENYKVLTGKKKFFFNGKYKNKNFALKIINENHEQWYNKFG